VLAIDAETYSAAPENTDDLSDPEKEAKLVRAIEADSSLSLKELMRRTGFGHERVKKVAAAHGWFKQGDNWVYKLIQSSDMPGPEQMDAA
jgi:hypothetical protein